MLVDANHKTLRAAARLARRVHASLDVISNNERVSSAALSLYCTLSPSLRQSIHFHQFIKSNSQKQIRRPDLSFWYFLVFPFLSFLVQFFHWTKFSALFFFFLVFKETCFFHTFHIYFRFETVNKVVFP